MVGKIKLSINTMVPLDMLHREDLAHQEHDFDNSVDLIPTIQNILRHLQFEQCCFSLDLVLNAYLFQNKSKSSVNDPKETTANTDLLSIREKEVLRMVCNGLTSKEIAGKLFISLETVKTHRKHIREKTGSKNAATLFRILNLVDTNNKNPSL
jgi:DNA-binding CsgD family transcriptional regulator